MDRNILVDTGLILGICLCLIITVSQLLLKRKDQKNYLIALNTFLIAVYQFSSAFYLFSGIEKWYAVYPYVYTIGRFVLFAAAPVYYFFFKSLPKKEYIFRPLHLLHIVIPVAVSLILIIYAEYPVDSGGNFREYKDFLYANVGIFRPLSIFSSFYGIVYFFIILVYYIHLFRRSKEERQKNLSTVIIFSLITIAPLFPYIVFGNRIAWFYDLFQLRFAILSVYLLLISQRYPFLLNIIKLEAYRDYYLKSNIEDAEADRVYSALEQLMNEEKLFVNNDLFLKNAAQKLKVSNLQLSEVLNIHQGKTFSQYIKEKRINYSLELLESKPSMTVLDIALECGFNSKSSYYAAFQKMIGETPLQYRKKRSRNIYLDDH